MTANNSIETTVTTAASAPAGTVARKAPAGRRRLRNLLVTLLVSAFASLGLATVTAAPAHAATGVTFCFITNYGQPLDRELVSWYVWYNGTWHIMGNARTGTNGCGYVDTSRYYGYYVRVAAGASLVTRWRGEAPRYANPGYGTAHLGTGVAWLPYI